MKWCSCLEWELDVWENNHKIYCDYGKDSYLCPWCGSHLEDV